jgi:hypothetical protein
MNIRWELSSEEEGKEEINKKRRERESWTQTKCNKLRTIIQKMKNNNTFWTHFILC